ncbi:hypothetical protein [Actinopolymorpha sp. B9G3]|uniref:hypothetical protein n=1 Tax=Actinopolymorpha sp. B9G3 TaxID=3158970 RepID=UPI0032D8BBAC
MPDRRPRPVRRAVPLGVLLLALAASAGCVSLPETRTGRSPEWSPASQDKTIGFLQRYDKINAKASAARDSDLIESIQSGPLLTASQAQFRIAKRLDPDDKNPGAAVSHSDPRAYLPAFEGYPVWYFAVSKVAGEGDTAVDLVMRPTAGSLWRKAQSVVLDDDAEVPEILDRDSAAVVVPPGEREGRARAPAEAAAAYAALLEEGPEAPQAPAFVPHPDTERSHRASQQNRSQANAFTYDQEFSVTSVRALATKDGGALVLFTMTEAESLAMRNASLEFDQDDAVAAYTGLAKGEAFLRTSWIWQVVAAVPMQDAEDIRVRILGTERSLASADMK